MAFRFGKRSKANLVGVHSDLVRVMTRALEISSIDFVIVDGLRTLEEQRELVRQGKSRTMNSRHLTGHAVDVAPIDPATGKVELIHWPIYHRLAKFIKRAAQIEGVAVEWGGDWKSFQDGPHWQLSRRKYPAITPLSLQPRELKRWLG